MEIVRGDLKVPVVKYLRINGTIIENTAFIGDRDIKLESMANRRIETFNQLQQSKQEEFEKLMDEYLRLKGE